MAERAWTLDQLKALLAERGGQLKGWVINQEHIQRRERYFLREMGGSLGVDQDRETRVSSTSVKLFVRLADERKQGEITKKLTPLKPLPEQLDDAIRAAQQTELQAWVLPEKLNSPAPMALSRDPKIAEDMERAMTQITADLAAAVAIPRETAFNSAEVFVSLHDRELHFSSGLVHRNSQSRIYAEMACSYTRKGPHGESISDEYCNSRWAVCLDDLNIEKLFAESSERARHSLDVIKPVTGRYAVIVDAEVLSVLLNGQIGQLSAVNCYQRLPFIKPGDFLVPDATGDLLTLKLDPTLDFGADTVAVSDHGELQRPLELVRENRVVATASDKQYSDYLKIPSNTVRGSLSVEGGTCSFAELTRHAPQVLEILQFSGLFCDSTSGTFASEIRLARLYDNTRGTVSYVKGGSLSGSLLENLKAARFSRSKVRRAYFSTEMPRGEGYYGPEYGLLSDVSIVG